MTQIIIKFILIIFYYGQDVQPPFYIFDNAYIFIETISIPIFQHTLSEKLLHLLFLEVINCFKFFGKKGFVAKLVNLRKLLLRCKNTFIKNDCKGFTIQDIYFGDNVDPPSSFNLRGLNLTFPKICNMFNSILTWKTFTKDFQRTHIVILSW
jgi:hypothetical protein